MFKAQAGEKIVRIGDVHPQKPVATVRAHLNYSAQMGNSSSNHDALVGFTSGNLEQQIGCSSGSAQYRFRVHAAFKPKAGF